MKLTFYPRLLLPALALLAIALRWMERSRLIYGWDTVHYLLAQDRYDLFAHQPHPPGSYYYVLLARAIRLMAGEGHAALLVISAFFGGALVVVLYYLGRELAEDEGAGWLAAALGVSAPLFWFYGSVALNYGPSGTLSALVALGCVLGCGIRRDLPEPERNRRAAGGVLLAGMGLGLLGGFRPTDVVFLLPAFLWTLGCAWRSGVAVRSLALGLALLGLLTVGWLVPTLINTGGLAGYVNSIRGQEHLLARSSALLAGDPALKDALYTHQRSCESLLGVGWLLVFAAPLARCFGVRSTDHGRRGAIWLLGVLIVGPAFLFYLFGHFNSPGYILTYGGFAASAAAAAIAALHRAIVQRVPRSGWVLVLMVAGLLTGNTALFLCGWPGAAMKGQRSLSAVEIRDHDGYYRDLGAFLTRSHPPGTVRLLSSWNSTDGLRTVQNLLPDYAADVAQAVGEIPDLPESFAALDWLRLMTPRQIREEGRPVYLITRTHEDPGYHISLFQSRWEEVSIGPGHRLYRLHPIQGEQSLHVPRPQR